MSPYRDCQCEVRGVLHWQYDGTICQLVFRVEKDVNKSDKLRMI